MNIPTAEEFLHERILEDVKQRKEIPEEYHKSVAETLSGKIHEENYYAKAMIYFAQAHCQAALKAAAENATLDDAPDDYDMCPECFGVRKVVNKDSILSAYPKENIK